MVMCRDVVRVTGRGGRGRVDGETVRGRLARRQTMSGKRARYGDGSVFQASDGRWVARLAYTDVHGRRKRAEKRCSTKTKATAGLREMRRQADVTGNDHRNLGDGLTRS